MTDKETKTPAFVPRPRPVTACKAIVWGALGVLLYVAHVAFIPVALALLFGLVLSVPSKLTQNTGPTQLKRCTHPCHVLSALGGIVALMWTPAQEWFAKAPQTMAIIKQKAKPDRGVHQAPR